MHAKLFQNQLVTNSGFCTPNSIQWVDVRVIMSRVWTLFLVNQLIATRPFGNHVLLEAIAWVSLHFAGLVVATIRM